VDLAGSENVGRSGAVDKRLREAGMMWKLLFWWFNFTPKLSLTFSSL